MSNEKDKEKKLPDLTPETEKEQDKDEKNLPAILPETEEETKEEPIQFDSDYGNLTDEDGTVWEQKEDGTWQPRKSDQSFPALTKNKEEVDYYDEFDLYGFNDGSDGHVTLDDVYNRGGSHYTRQGNRSLGWENNSYSSGLGYSSYLFGGSFNAESNELLTKSFAMAKNLLTAMNLPVKWHLDFTSSSTTYNMGQKITLATEIFDQKTKDATERMDVFLGEAVHEGGHKTYTDEKVYDNYLHDQRYQNEAIGNTKHAILQTIEDERIENEISKDFPGYTTYIEKLKTYTYEDVFTRELPQWETLNDAQKLLLTFVRIARYPTLLRKEDLTKYGKLIKKIKNIILPLAKDTEEATVQTEAIFKLLEEEFKEMAHDVTKDLKPLQNKEKQLQEAIAKLQEELQKLANEMDNTAEDRDMADNDAEYEKLCQKLEEQRKEQKEKQKEELSLEKQLEKLQQQMQALKEKSCFENGAEGLAEEIADNVDCAKVEVNTGSNKKCGDLKNDNSDITRNIYVDLGYVDEGVEENVYFLKEKEKDMALDTYQKDRKEIEPYASALGRKLRFQNKDYKISIKATRSGILDTNKLAEAIQGCSSVYERTGEVKSSKVAVCLLVDESGSMHGSKIKQARKTAILLETALLKNRDVELFVYGHTADNTKSGDTNIHVYREPGFQTFGAMGGISARGNNRDGTAISEVSLRIRKFTQRPCIMFVISDGSPAANGYGHGREHTKQMVKKFEKKGFVITQIAIEQHHDPSTMFTNFVKFTSISDLPKDIGKLMSKLVKAMTNAEIIIH